MTFIESIPFDINEQLNGSTQEKFGPLQQYINRCRGCNQNLTSNNPASRYQKLKLIQNTVRVASSIYTMNIGALNVYQRPNKVYSTVELDNFGYIVSPGVNWNQMSDRKEPHIQKVVGSSGSAYGGNSLKRTLTSIKPGALSPGGVGVDIKHNSYDRYLARLKGKGVLRRGVIPKIFKYPELPFDPAYPVYGSKLFKTAIVSNCDCPEDSGIPVREIYEGKEQDEIFNVKYTFREGDIILAPYYDILNNASILKKATILKVNQDNQTLVVFFADINVTKVISMSLARIYLFDKCDLGISPCAVTNGITVPLDFKYITDGTLSKCLLLNYAENIPN